MDLWKSSACMWRKRRTKTDANAVFMFSLQSSLPRWSAYRLQSVQNTAACLVSRARRRNHTACQFYTIFNSIQCSIFKSIFVYQGMTKRRPTTWNMKNTDKENEATRAKYVLPNKPHAGRRNHPQQRQNGPVCCWVTLFAASAFYSVTVRGDGSAQTARFCPWWPWPLTLILGIQTRPSEGPNTSSLWIWRKAHDVT